MSKIIQHIQRDGDEEEESPVTLSISSIAALEQTDALNNDALFEVSIPYSGERYTSKCVSWATIAAKIEASESQAWNGDYDAKRDATIPIEGPELSKTVWSYLFNVWKPTPQTKEDFLGGPPRIDEPQAWYDIWTLTKGEEELCSRVKEVEDTVNSLEETRTAFAPDMTFMTTLCTFKEGNETLTRAETSTTTMTQAYEDPQSGVNSKGFVLAFFQKNKISNVFECPCDGVLTLYGWLDSSNVANLKYLPTSWCALMGNINNRWEILQVQSVLPAKQFSYVSFCVPVVKGLKVRCELGFVPGEASGRYDKTVSPTSLANTQPNAFLGGVYSLKMEDETEENP